MINLQDALAGATELLHGPQVPSLKLALFAAAMSAMQSLGKNGLQARILARYASRPLPDRPQLVKELKQARGNLNGNHINALYRIQELADVGILDQFDTLPTSYTEQSKWRDDLLYYLTGYGMGRKTISFAALIYSPLTCQLVPIDRHVLRRLGYQTNNSPQRLNQYLAIEALVAIERNEAGYAHIPLGIWHWFKWESWRQEQGDSLATDCVESHRLLSCRDYSLQ